MPRKPAADQFDTLQAIRREAFRLFGQFGYEGVSVGDIAKASKISKGALYWHYRGKEELYLDCLRQLHAIFNEHIFDPMRAANDPAAGLAQIFVGLQKLVGDARVADGVAGYWLIPSRAEATDFLDAQREFEKASARAIHSQLLLGAEQDRFNLGDAVEDLPRAIITVVEAVVLPMRNQSRDEVQRNLRVLARTLFLAYAKPDDIDAILDLI